MVDARSNPAASRGGLAGARAIWAWADLLNGVMAIPNLIAIVLLARPVAQRLSLASPSRSPQSADSANA